MESGVHDMRYDTLTVHEMKELAPCLLGQGAIGTSLHSDVIEAISALSVIAKD
jgi:hypothetical protein